MTIEEKIADLTARVTALESASGLYATESDLASSYGDPTVKFTPRAYAGPDVKGLHYSQCPPEALDAIAEALTYSGQNPKEGKEKYAKYDLTDARRARSWARRLRAGWKPAAPAADTTPAPSFDAPSFEDDIPF
jgi:hypothetical protein